jgi:tetratricopeptide (TPR) repeat protein
LGKALLSLGQAEDAIAAFNNALALKPHYAEAQRGLATTAISRGEVDAAIACLLLAISYRPDYVQAMAELGAAFFRKGDIATATSWSQAALAIDPDHAGANNHLALISRQAGNLDEANRYIERARTRPPSIGIKIPPDSKRTVLIIGMTTRAGNMSPSTIEFVFPGNANTHINWAVDLAATDDVDDLPYYDLAFNALGDPDMTGDVTQPIGRFLAACAKPLLNHPDKVLLTARGNLPRLLADIDSLIVPEVWRCQDNATWDDAISEHLPLLVRPVDTHGGEGMVLAHTAGELAKIRNAQSTPVYVTRYVDFRSGDNLFRKYRIIYIDRQPYPYHLAISPHWMVHYYTAEMENHPWKLEEEKRFLDNPEAALGSAGWQAIRAIGTRMDLDYAGIDFSLMADGRVLVFEANPSMLIHPESLHGPLAHKNVHVFKLAAKFEEMLARKTVAVA